MNLDKNNRIYNGLDVYGKGDNSSTSGLTVFNSGLTTSLIVRDDSKVGINTNEITRYLDINGDLRIRTINFNPEPPRMLVADANGYVYWDAKPTTFANPSGDTYIISAYTSGCTLYLINNSGSTYTADTCNDVGPYKWSVGPNSIQPRFPATPFTNIVKSQYSVISSGGGPGGANPWPWVAGNFIDGSGASDDGSVTGDYNSISAGFKNCIFSGTTNSIINGYSNVCNSFPPEQGSGLLGYIKKVQYSTILNGWGNILSGTSMSLIGGGTLNRIGGLRSIWNKDVTDNTILCGRLNVIDSKGTEVQYNHILNGNNGYINTEESFEDGYVNFYYNNINNGAYNRISVDGTLLENNASLLYSTIGNGIRNRIYLLGATGIYQKHTDIFNGTRNSASTTTHSTILNGDTNKIQGYENVSTGHLSKYNTIINGSGNTISTTGRYQPREYNTIVNGRNNDLTDISGSTIVAGSDIHGWHDDTVFSRNYSGQTYFSASTTTVKSVEQRAVNSVLNWGTHDDPNPADGTITYGFMKVFKYDSNAGGNDNPDDPDPMGHRPNPDDKPKPLVEGETEEERAASSPPALNAGATLNLRHNLNTYSIITQMFDHNKRMVGPSDPNCCETALTVTVTGPDTVSIYNGGPALNFGWYVIIMGM